jgi:predicted nucleic acid-binding protein
LIDPVTSRELGIQENDLWIAAQALEYNLVLVTNDKMDRIRDVCEDLQVENWTAHASE